MKKQISIIAAMVLVLVLFSCKGAVGPSGPSGTSSEAGWFSKSYQQGVDTFTGCYDVRIWDYYPTTAYGTSTTSWVGGEYSSASKKRMIIEFYPAGWPLPAGAVIQKATLSLKTALTVQGNPAFTFYEMNESWIEGETTWNNRTAAIAWTTAGGDYVTTTASDSVRVTGINTWYTWTLDKSLVERKIASPTSTYGFIMVADAEAATYNCQAEFVNKENVTAADRPKLTIYYTLP